MYAPYLGGGVISGPPGGFSPFTQTQTFNDFALTSVQGPWTFNISDRAAAGTSFFFGRSFAVTPQAALPSAAPEPGSLALLLPVVGVAGMVIRKRKK